MLLGRLQANSRPLCLENEHSLSEVLRVGAVKRPRLCRRRRLLPRLARRRVLCLPAAGPPLAPDARDPHSTPPPHTGGDAELAGRDVVATGVRADTPAATPHSVGTPNELPDIATPPHAERGASVATGDERSTLSTAALNLQHCRLRASTRSSYKAKFRTYKTWCAAQNYAPDDYDPIRVANFLADRQSAGTNCARGLRCYVFALDWAWGTGGTGPPRLSQNTDILAVLRGARANDPPPEDAYPAWAVGPVLTRLSALPTSNLSQEGHRLLLLLTLCTSWRPRSDMGRISRDRISFTLDDGAVISWRAAIDHDSTPRSAQLVALLPKEGPIKRCTIPRWDADATLCPVRALQSYLRRTKNSTSKKLFVNPVKINSALAEDTLGKWTRDTLFNCGVLSNAHATRSTSASHAAISGVAIERILEAANWSTAQTFRRYYWRGPPETPAPEPGQVAIAVLSSALGPTQGGQTPT